MGLQIPPTTGTSSSVLLSLSPGLWQIPLQTPFPSIHCPFPSAHDTYLASWMRTMMVHRPISPHTLAVPISAKTSTHSSTLSQVNSVCWGSDCKTQRGGVGQDAGSVWELNRAEIQLSLVGLQKKAPDGLGSHSPRNKKAMSSLWPEFMQEPTSLSPSRGRLRNHSTTEILPEKQGEHHRSILDCLLTQLALQGSLLVFFVALCLNSTI